MSSWDPKVNYLLAEKIAACFLKAIETHIRSDVAHSTLACWWKCSILWGTRCVQSGASELWGFACLCPLWCPNIKSNLTNIQVIILLPPAMRTCWAEPNGSQVVKLETPFYSITKRNVFFIKNLHEKYQKPFDTKKTFAPNTLKRHDYNWPKLEGHDYDMTGRHDPVNAAMTWLWIWLAHRQAISAFGIPATPCECPMVDLPWPR